MSSLAERRQSQPMTAGDAKDAVKEKGQEVRTQASDLVRQELDERSTQAGEQVRNFAQTMRRTASELRAQGQYGQSSLFDQVAIRAEQLGSYLTQADADQLVAQAKRTGGRVLGFVRKQSSRVAPSRNTAKNPFVLGTGAIAAGVLLRRRMQGSSRRSRSQQPQALEQLTKKELEKRASSAGVDVKSSMTKQELIAALRSERGRSGARRKANPVEVQEFLVAVRYPAGKTKLLNEAKRQGADRELRNTLQRLPQKRFRGPTEVSKAIGNLK